MFVMFQIAHNIAVKQALQVIPALTVSRTQHTSINNDHDTNTRSTSVTVKEEQVLEEENEALQSASHKQHEEIDIEDLQLETRFIKVEYESVSIKKEEFVDCDNNVKSNFSNDVNDVFKRESLLVKHLKLHNRGEPYSCKRCNRAFTSNHYLTTHMLIHNEKTYSCDKCDMSFTNTSNLNRHITRIHTKERPYSCNRCDKTFSVKYTLTRHMLVHTGVKPYSCNTCHKTFTEQGHLTRHKRIHSGDKTYPCNQCDKIFYETFNLARHLRTHTGEKPYSCNLCDKTFNEKGQLKRHMQVHTGATRSYSCDVCTNTFTEKGNLRKHIVNLHGNKERKERGKKK